MDRPYESAAEIESLVSRFVECTLPCAEWTHRAHLTVGLWHAREYSPDEALARMRAGILRYNTTCQVPNTPTRGHHETITRFYMTVLTRHLTEQIDTSDWTAVTNRALELFGARDLPFEYYTRERLMSSEARAEWREPDLRPLH
jgi:hypothetical protein